LLIFVKRLSLVRGVRVLHTVATNFVHLIVFKAPVAVALLAVEFDDLLHYFHHQFVWLMHFVNLQANRALVVSGLVSCISGKLLQAGFASTSLTLWTLEDSIERRNKSTYWAFEVIGLDH